MSNYLVLDIATMPLPNAAEYVVIPPPPLNYKLPQSIENWKWGKQQEALERAALDWDLGRIAVIGVREPTHGAQHTAICKDEADERRQLDILSGYADQLITFNGYKFDLPFLNARARYLRVDLKLNCDPYRSRHLDLYDVLTQHGKLPGKSLEFYTRRYGWTDLVKPLTGAQEAIAAVEGRYDEVAACVAVDLQRTARLARVMGLGGPHVDDPIL